MKQITSQHTHPSLLLFLQTNQASTRRIKGQVKVEQMKGKETQLKLAKIMATHLIKHVIKLKTDRISRSNTCRKEAPYLIFQVNSQSLSLSL